MLKKITLLVLLLSLLSNIYSQDNIKKIQIEDLWTYYSFYAPGVRGLSSMNNGLHYTTYSRGKILKSSYKTGNVIDTIVDINNLNISNYSAYKFNSDESKILIETNYERIYRRSYTATYYIYDLKTKKITGLSKNKKQQLASFSPNGDKVAFVRKNNIYIKDIEKDNEIQITNDGEFNKIINGAPDWVYEEEFGFNKAFQWSPDGKYIAFMKFDESNVKTFSMTVFAGKRPLIKKNVLYPETRTWKYPKTGDANSILTVHVYNTKTKKTNKMDIGDEKDQYIPRIRWTKNAEKLSIIRVNRLQNKLELLLSDVKNGKHKVIYTDENKYFIDESQYDDIIFLKDKKHFVTTNEKDGYRHLYLYSLKGKLIRQLTKGKWDITKYIGFDKKNKIFYYISAEESPLRRSVYSIGFDGKNKKKLSTAIGTNNAKFSKTYKYYINTFSNIETPTYVSLHSADGKLIRVLRDNSRIAEKVKKYGGVNKEFIKFKTSENVELNGYMVKPYNFDKNKKYPVMMYQYSGPNSQSVDDSWDFGWDNLLAQNGYIVVVVDGRGTAARGEEFRKMTYLQLGKYEVIDQIETAKYLGNLPYVDKSRIGIWGWSYGGFMTLLALTKGADYFKMGISVAPVTNWRYYDNIYTERYMRTPQENPSGYDDNSPIFHVDKFKGKLLIVHGSADDNVHVQNTMEFIEAMVQANKQFDMMIYTNRNHSIYGGNTRVHLYNKMLNYILNNL